LVGLVNRNGVGAGEGVRGGRVKDVAHVLASEEGGETVLVEERRAAGSESSADEVTQPVQPLLGPDARIQG